MNQFIEPTETLSLSLREGTGQVMLRTDEYYYLQRGEEFVPVIKHDALIRLAENNGFVIDKKELEYGIFNSPKNFCFVHRAFGTLPDGTKVDEVGEANPNNLDSGIGGAYPAIMSIKRAQDRLLIRLMGLQGQVYSDTEFSGNNVAKGKKNQNSKAKEETKASTPTNPEAKVEENGEEEGISREQAENMLVTYGKYGKNPVRLAELKEKSPADFEWLAHTYKPNNRSKKHMLQLHQAAKLLAEEG